jgi:hypothetical protein
MEKEATMSRLASVVGIVLVIVIGLSGETPAQITNYQISYPSYQLQNEEQVFYCPTDSNVIIADWRDWRLGYRRCGIGRSTDGGATWSDHLNDSMLNWDNYQSDPTMTVDRLGRFYCCFLDYSVTWADSSFISFIRSDDKGATWSSPHAVEKAPGPYFEDKQFITADRTGGAYDGSVYVSWARFPNPTRIMFARSLDGAVTFEDTVIVGPQQDIPACGSTFDAGQFAQPIVGADGSVHVFWSGYQMDPITCDYYYAMKMSKSTDGGQTWPIQGRPIVEYNRVSYVDGNIDVYNCPAGDADITDGPYDGTIYISYLNGTDDSAFTHADIYLIKSTDGGDTWTAPLRVNDDPLGFNVDQFHPWLTVNQDGVVTIIFYDQRMDPAHYLFDVFAAYSFDGGRTFTTNHRLTTVSSSPDHLLKSAPREQWEGQFDPAKVYHYLNPMAGRIAEYIGVTSFHDKVSAVWTDTRNGNQDVFGATYTIPFLKPRLFGVPNGSYIGSNPADLVWSTCWHEDNDSYRVEISADPTFLTTNLVAEPTDNILPHNALLALTDGVYYWRVKAFRNGATDSTDYSDVWSFTLDLQTPSLPVLLLPDDGERVYTAKPKFVWSAAGGTPVSPEYFELEVSVDSLFSGTPPYFHYTGLIADSLTLPDPLPAETTYFWRVNHYDLAGNNSGYTPYRTFRFFNFKCGDVNNDLKVGIGDAVWIVIYIFRGGPAPDPLVRGDINLDGNVNIGDAVYLVNYIFRGGPAPCNPIP